MSKLNSPGQDSGGSSDWMTTYSDMVTLLFTFFVLLFAISQVDVQKFNQLVASLNNKGASPELIMEIGSQHDLDNKDAIDPEDPRIPYEVDGEENPLQKAYDELEKYIAQSGNSEKVSIALGNDYIFIRFADDMLFDANSYRIRSQDYELLSFIGEGLRMIENDIGMIRIDGHTAAIPENENYPVSDRDLSSDRANAVLKYLEDNTKIRGDKLAAFSFGKHRPVGDNNTEEGRAQNRRIEILVTSVSNIDIQLDNIYEKLNE